MRIERVDVAYVRARRRFGFGDSRCGLVRIATEDGTVGVGEISDIEDPEAAPSAAAVAETLESFLVGADPRRLNHLTTAMFDRVDFGPVAFHSFQQLALAGVDAALFDLAGRALDVPAYQLLGGRTSSVPVSWVAFTRGTSEELARLEAEVREMSDRGFEAFKLKVGDVDPETDEERVRTVREVAGEDATLLLDAQGNWTAEEAVENVRRLEPYGIDGVETPAGHPDHSVDAPGYYYDVPLVPADLRRVKEAVDTPVVEHVLDPAFGLELAAADAVDVFTVETCAGGIARAERVLDVAAAAGLDARLGSTVELGPGTAAGVALATSSPAVTYPCDLVGPALYETEVLADPLSYRDGRLHARDAPGLGVDLRADVF